MGRDRTFIITPDESANLALPTDLLGVSVGTYKTVDEDAASAVRSAAQTAFEAMDNKGPRTLEAAAERPPDLWAEAASAGLLPALAATPQDQWMEMWVWHFRYGVGRIVEVGPPNSSIGQWVSVEFSAGVSQIRVTSLRAGRLTT